MSFASRKGKMRDRSIITQPYVLYGSKLSFFTQKLWAALAWYFPDCYIFSQKGPSNSKQIEIRSGTHQVPVLETPEGWIINDTTPIFHLLQPRILAAHGPISASLYPSGITGAICMLMEEYFDEWSARWTIHTRWNKEESAKHASRSMARSSVGSTINENQVDAIARTIAGWGKRVVRAIGVKSKIQQRAAEEELLRIYTALDKHLENHQFILGAAPCAVDAVLVGGLRAHFLEDPWPKNKFAHLLRLKAYMETRDTWNCNINYHQNQEKQQIELDPKNLPTFIKLILEEMNVYKQFVLGNREALLVSDNKKKK